MFSSIFSLTVISILISLTFLVICYLIGFNKVKRKNLARISLVGSMIFLITGCPPSEINDPCLSALADAPYPSSPTQVTAFPPERKSDVMIILDVSGSMDEFIDSGTSGGSQARKKIEDAREAVTQLVKNTNSELFNIEFAAFGHKNLTCQNNVEKIDEDINSVLTQLEPKGETPLAQTIKEIGNSLMSENKNSKTTIVLISDGEDTCGGDPCNEVKSLKEKGLEFVFHAIPYGTDVETNQQLKCLADEGDGKLYTPQNIQELQRDLNEAVYGVGTMSVKKIENPNVKGWKLYEKGARQSLEEAEAIKEEQRTKKTDANLWLEQKVLTGSYDFCLYFQDNTNPVIKEVSIVKDERTDVDITQ